MNSTSMQESRPDQLTHAALVENLAAADALVAALRQAGLPDKRLSIVSDKSQIRQRAQGVDVQPSAGRRTVTAICLGALAGLVVGGGGAALAGLLSGGSQAQLLVGALFPFAAALVGGFVGAMLTRGAETEPENFHDQEAQPGQVLVAVALNADDPAIWAQTADATIRHFGAKPLGLPHG